MSLSSNVKDTSTSVIIESINTTDSNNKDTINIESINITDSNDNDSTNSNIKDTFFESVSLIYLL